MKNLLKRYCQDIGIDRVGIAPIGPYLELGEKLKAKINTQQCTEFDETDIQKRVTPALLMPKVQSIIVCLFPYYIGETPDANISKYTYSLDYHQIIKSKLTQVGTFLANKIASFEYQVYVDTGPLVDRYLAYLAGLGTYGLNNHIITEKYGSYVLIGYILTNYPFEFDKPLEGTCSKCEKCIRACPGACISDNFNIDPRTCRSYLTQKKGELTESEINILKKGKLIYGCDVCQDVCPHNSKVNLTNMAEFKTNILSNINSEDLLNISNKEFKARYGNRAFAWRGKQILLRNASLLKNSR